MIVTSDNTCALVPFSRSTLHIFYSILFHLADSWTVLERLGVFSRLLVKSWSTVIPVAYKMTRCRVIVIVIIITGMSIRLINNFKLFCPFFPDCPNDSNDRPQTWSNFQSASLLLLKIEWRSSMHLKSVNGQTTTICTENRTKTIQG